MLFRFERDAIDYFIWSTHDIVCKMFDLLWRCTANNKYYKMRLFRRKKSKENPDSRHIWQEIKHLTFDSSFWTLILMVMEVFWIVKSVACLKHREQWITSATCHWLLTQHELTNRNSQETTTTGDFWTCSYFNHSKWWPLFSGSFFLLWIVPQFPLRLYRFV